jgi:hypothetical protein
VNLWDPSGNDVSPEANRVGQPGLNDEQKVQYAFGKWHSYAAANGVDTSFADKMYNKLAYKQLYTGEDVSTYSIDRLTKMYEEEYNTQYGFILGMSGAATAISKAIGGLFAKGAGKTGLNLSRNITKTSELDTKMLSNLKNEGVVSSGGRSGGARPLEGTANSYVKTDAGHTLVYDENGRLIYDISSERVKMTVWDKAPNGNFYNRDIKLEGPVPNDLLK